MRRKLDQCLVLPPIVARLDEFAEIICKCNRFRRTVCDEEDSTHRSTYNDSWIARWWPKRYVSFNDSLSSLFFSIGKKYQQNLFFFFFEAGYDTCNLCNFANLRSLLLSTSISYSRRQRPIRDLATFFSKSDNSTPSTLEELKILFRQDVPGLRHQKSEDTMHIFQHQDWRIMEHKLSDLNLFPALHKLCIGLRPKDVGTFMNEPLRLALKSSLGNLMPKLYTMIKIEVFDGMFFIAFSIASKSNIFIIIGSLQIGLNNSRNNYNSFRLIYLSKLLLLEFGRFLRPSYRHLRTVSFRKRRKEMTVPGHDIFSLSSWCCDPIVRQGDGDRSHLQVWFPGERERKPASQGS